MLSPSIPKSKCPHCQKTQFEAVVEKVKNYSFPLAIIRCESCQTVISVLEDKNVSGLIKEYDKTHIEKIDELTKKVVALSEALDRHLRHL